MRRSSDTMLDEMLKAGDSPPTTQSEKIEAQMKKAMQEMERKLDNKINAFKNALKETEPDERERIPDDTETEEGEERDDLQEETDTWWVALGRDTKQNSISHERE